MINSLKKCVIHIFHTFTRVFCIVPIQKNKICFEAFMGKQYSCSPKYICEYIDSVTDKFELVWVRSKEKVPCNYKQVRRNSFLYFYHMLTAGTVVINAGKNKLLKFRKKQLVINTWHGGGAYKKIVHPGYDEHYRSKDYYISSCKKASEHVIREGQNFHGEILKFGLPRNDLLINYDEGKANRVRQALGLVDKKCILYAPTFREDKTATDFELDYIRLLINLKNRFGGDWVVLHRGHYHMVEHKMNEASENVIDVTKYPDMQELLLISDVLITDYSSSIWDYSFLYRPVFLYATDLERYDLERSFFIDIHEWPFQLCRNNDELAAAIESFDQKCMEKKIVEHHEYMGSYEIGKACKLTYEFICKHVKNL